LPLYAKVEINKVNLSLAFVSQGWEQYGSQKKWTSPLPLYAKVENGKVPSKANLSLAFTRPSRE